MKNKQVKKMMVDVENNIQGIKGYKTLDTLGWHGFDESGLFHCSGSNFIWLYQKTIVSIKGKIQ